MKILVAVASRFTQRILKRHLEFLTQPPVFCVNLTEARAELARGEFDLICLEGLFVDGSAIDFTRQLRATPAGAHLPVLLLSGNADQKLAADALAAGITEIFSKNDVVALADYIARQEAHDIANGLVRGLALIVEDSRPVAAIFERMLTHLGMSSVVHARAEDALADLGRQKFDVVITDVQLEGNMTGLGLVRSIRQLKSPAARVPILAVSSLQDPARKVELLRQGANDFVSKPVQEEEFAVRVGNMVRLTRLIEEAETQRDNLRRLAMTDQLTGLFNRHYLADVASRRISETARHGIPASLLVIDLDHFKKINDTYGHDTGDVVLAEVGTLLRELCRGGDIAARMGGEEFVFVLVNRDARAATEFAETVRSRIMALKPAGLEITASIGVGALPRGQSCDFKALFKVADEAVYAAKAGGRNQVVRREIALASPR